MNRFLLALVLCCVMVSQADFRQTSKTLMRIRPLYDTLFARLAFWKDMIQQQEGNHTIVNALGIYGHSLSPCELGTYFSIRCKHELTVKGDDFVSRDDGRDVRAEWVGLPSNFSGTVEINPEHRQCATLLQATQRLEHWSDHSFVKDLWLFINMPVVSVRNNFGFRASSEPLAQAFVPKTWHAGKMDHCWRKKTIIPEVRLGFGTRIVDQNDFHVITLSAIIIPTVRHFDNRYMFSPIVGYQGHVGISNMIGIDMPIHPCDASYKAHLYLDIENVFLMGHRQKRLFDLRNKPWSRYMLFRKKAFEGEGGMTSVESGVNLLNLPVRVHPFSTVDLSFGAKVQCGCFLGMLGYGLWGTGKERVTFLKPRCAGSPLPITQYGIAGTGTASASRSNVAVQAPNDEKFERIKLSDVDQSSGAGQGGFSNRMNIVMGYFSDCAYLGAGAWYETPVSNTIIRQYGFWINAGYSF